MADPQYTSYAVRYAVRDAQIPMIDLSTFILEEYKAIQTKISQYRDISGRLESFTLGGTVAGVGFLMGRTRCDDFPFTRFAWWGLVALVVVAAFSHTIYTFIIFESM